jgi:predicted nucleic acid-binding protein
VGLIDALPAGPVAVDTVVFVHFVEQHTELLPVIRPLFVAADSGSLRLVTSAITLLEVLVVPYRAGDLALASRYETLLTRSRGLTLVELERQVLRAAAHLRARSGIRTPDALQIAAALAHRCSAFITNDQRLPRVSDLPVFLLSDYV